MSLRLIAVAIVAVLVGFLAMTQAGPSSEVTASVPVPTDGPAQPGDTVMLHYVGKTVDGDIFEQTMTDKPRGVQIGSQQVLPALEQALVGIRAGESREVRIASADAFGPYRDDPGMKTRMMRAALSHRLDPYVGMRLNAAVFSDENETQPIHVPVTVIEVTDEYLVVDANHPLAGKDLVFEVEAVEVIRAGQ
jgi:peptidylprolyl isomerase